MVQSGWSGGGRAPCGFMGCGMGRTIAQCEGCRVLQDGIFSNRMQCCSERAWEMELPRQCSCGTVHFLYLWGSRALGFCALMVGGRLREGGAKVQARRGRGLCADSERAESVCRLREGGASVQSLALGRWMLEEGAGLGAGLDPGLPLWSLCPVGEVTWVPVSATFMLSAQGRSLTSLCLHLPFRKPGVMSSPQLGSLQRFNALLWDSVWPRGGAQKSISIRAFRVTPFCHPRGDAAKRTVILILTNEEREARIDHLYHVSAGSKELAETNSLTLPGNPADASSMHFTAVSLGRPRLVLGMSVPTALPASTTHLVPLKAGVSPESFFPRGTVGRP